MPRMLSTFILWLGALQASARILNLDDAITLRLKQSTGDRVFVDARGRERIFHGTNVVVKGPPWHADYEKFSNDVSMSSEDFEVMNKLGLNLIRLGVMWPGVEPTKGNYNETYLDQLDAIVLMAKAHGIYTLLDMHQDGLSEHFCGEGLPSWATKRTAGGFLSGPFPSPFDTFNNSTDYYIEPRLGGSPRIPTKTACITHNLGPGWHESTEEASQAYQALWKNWQGITDAWGAMWAKVASRFAHRPEILGIELINEPYPGDIYHHPDILIPYPNPENGDRVNMQPAYDIVAKAIRAVNESVLIFFDGSPIDDFGVGFSAAPGGHEFADRSVVGYHYYVPPQDSATVQVDVMMERARALGTGVMCTETQDGYKATDVKDIADAADYHLQSWAGWAWKTFCREAPNQTAQEGIWGACKTDLGGEPTWHGGMPNKGFQTDNARTYATAVAGHIVKMRFDSTTSAFLLEYDFLLDSAALPTEIFVWPERYPGGAIVHAEASHGNVRVEYDGQSSNVRIHAEESLKNSSKVIVSIFPKNSPTPPPPESTCWYEVEFNFSKEVDTLSGMKDGDTVTMTKSPSRSKDPNFVDVVLSNTADNWWKAIVEVKSNDDFLPQQEIASVENEKKTDRGKIAVNNLRNGADIVLAKAKFLGHHKNVYCIRNADDMTSDYVYTFTWAVAVDLMVANGTVAPLELMV